MSDLTTPSTQTGGSATDSGATPGGPVSRVGGHNEMSTLTGEHGTTTIADNVVAKVAALATREVDGVAELGGSLSNAIGSVVGRIRGSGGSSSDPSTAGVGVEVGATQAAVDLTMKVLYPASIHQVADAVRQNVIDRIESMTGLDVVEVNIAVVDLVFPGDDDSGESSAPPPPPPPPPPRPTSRVE